MTTLPSPLPPSANATARELASLLGESDEKAFKRLREFALRFGRAWVMGIYQRAVEIEANGGLYFEDENGERKRRTFGGVFFRTAKDSYPSKEEKKRLLALRLAETAERDKILFKPKERAATPKPPASPKAPAAASKPDAAPSKVPEALKIASVPKPSAPSKVSAVPLSAEIAKPSANAKSSLPSRRGSGSRRGPKMPEVFVSVRTK